MRRALLAFAMLVGASSVRADAEDPDIVVRKWLVLPAVDQTARRTLRADAAFAKYLLDRASPPPKEGDEVTGTLGKPAKWAAREAAASEDPKEDGFVEAEGVGWSYASVESAEGRVVLAKLEGAGVLFVNGAGFAGDPYGLGDAGVPVALRKGANDVYVAGPRGGFRLSLVKPTSPVMLGARQVTPDEMEELGSEPPATAAAVVVLNATVRPIGVAPGSRPPLVPLGVGQLGLERTERLGLVGLGRSETRLFKLKLSDGTELVAASRSDSRHLSEPHRRTFISSIDGSVQSYALVPPAPSDIDKSKIGLVLSLHGAGVDCMDQARAYAPKPDFWIVCPTNRGRYGFDWQDWGRLDAYEVLEDALKVTGVDSRRVYLTGHSMGGHGTWHLAANDPGRFLAIAPSAGWSEFENYGAPPMKTPLAEVWRAADGASRTIELIQNLAPIPTYVLHGEKDDNVPLSEAQRMVDALTKAGGKPQSHFEPDAGHWWDKDEKRPGADCVDWPGIWGLFRKVEPWNFAGSFDRSFRSAEPFEQVVDPWINVDQFLDYSRPAQVRIRYDANLAAITITTENVRRLQWVPPPRTSEGTSTVDGVEIRKANHAVRIDGTWRASSDATVTSPQEKRPNRSGPFKRAFANRFVLVYGTAGDDAEDRELLEKARYDSEVWAYRANGDANLMSDEQFLAGDFKDRNVIVYGNADTNRAWGAVFDADCPIQARRGAMTVNGRKHEGVVAAAFVRPRKGSDGALAAAFADTGAAATRLFYAFPVFVSGVGIPDYVVFGPGFLREWDGDVRAAGWFDWAWRMK